MHHAVIDGRSILALLQRFEALLAARLSGQAAAPCVWPSGLDFLRERMRRIDHAAARAHWQSALSGLQAAAGFSLWPSRPEGEETAVHDAARDARPQLSGALSQLATDCGVTVNNVVQAAWALTVDCFTGERDVLFGATRSGRPSPRWACAGRQLRQHRAGSRARGRQPAGRRSARRGP